MSEEVDGWRDDRHWHTPKADPPPAPKPEPVVNIVDSIWDKEPAKPDIPSKP